jgi:CheY-like chemotaxis protein
MSLGPFVKKSVQFALSGANVVSHFDIAEDLYPCVCDQNQVGQVIDNIVINAKQAMPSGGRILVTCANENLPESRAPVPTKTGRFVKLSIEDNGVGMSKEVMARIFDPFFSTKDSGHGLGLATVYSIIQRHGGWVDVASMPGEGTTFHLHLPAAVTEDTSSIAPSAVSYRGAGPVLVMDDEDFMRDLLGIMLVSLGHTVVFAEDGEEAVSRYEEAKRAGTPFVACILDLTIPGGMGGKEAAVRIRETGGDVVLFASSGYSEDPVMSDPKQYGFTDRLVKPFRRSELAELMGRHF